MKKEKENISKETKDETNHETDIREKEVNVYGLGCGELRIHCMYDCFGDTPWLSTAK